MKSKWNKIEKWFSKNNAEVLKTFNSGADTGQLKELEDLIGAQLPKEFKDFYLIHDGQSTGTVFNSAIVEPDSEGLSAVKAIIENYRMYVQLNKEYATDVMHEDTEKGIKPLYWNNGWVPVVADGMGNHYCIDLDPAATGKHGQIIFRNHEGPTYELIAPSFEKWVDNFIGTYLG